jgi:penicillin-binding protein 2
MVERSISLRDHWQEQRLFLSRVLLAGAIVVLATAGLVLRLVQLQVWDHQELLELSQGNRLHIEPLAPTRGLIYDRNGLVIAENEPALQLIAIPEQIHDIDATLKALETLELVSPVEHETLAELVHSHRGFERVVLANLTEAQAARFAVRRYRFQGVDIQEGLIRTYPYGEVAAHAIGYVGSISRTDLEEIERADYAATTSIGKTGVERSYEAILHGDVGFRQQVVNAQGRVLGDPAIDDNDEELERTFGSLETRWPVPGDNLVLSLDMRIQLAAYEAMDGLRGAVVAMDPRNGDVLALVSRPSFDPERFARGLSRGDFVALNSDVDRPLFNRAISGRYPPGSTVKPFFGLAGLYHESVDPFAEVFCGGHFRLPGQTHRYRDWRPQGHGNMTLHTAIVQSCDVYFYRLAVELGIDRMESFMKQFGFGQRTGIDISGESEGVVPSREWKRQQFSRREDQVWFLGETVIAGIGQGFTLATPIQLAHAAAAMATRGQRHASRLLIGTEDNVSGEVAWAEPGKLPAVAGIDEAHWQIIQDALRGVVVDPGGSGRRALGSAEYTVAGKTGSAQVFSIAQDEEYEEEEVPERLRDHGLFFAYAPIEDPRIALAVVVENGGGSSAAVPIARQILDDYFEAEPYVARHR